MDQLTTIERPLLSLIEGINDTKLLAGSEAYSTALLFYQSVKLAAEMNIPGVKTIYDDLRERFPGRGPLRPGVFPDDTDNGASTEDVGVYLR
ncbi:MAG: hypothetical protein IPJ74_12035 [Saprospiraceae bacterium]|nr:hypothetical protein [Saprospiraceae bacterium]